MTHCADRPSSANRPPSPAEVTATPPEQAPAAALPEPGCRWRSDPGGALSRVLDVVIAAALLIAAGPQLLVIALLIRATSPGPAIFRQTRVGHRGRPFTVLKFRTMTSGSDDGVHRDFVTRMLAGADPRHGGAGGLFKLEGDKRVTAVGRLLRRTSLDELPQLVNVLRGEMSLVGPRPALPWEVALYQPRHHERFQVRPGITGLWQVSGRSRLSMTEALDLDVEYVRRRGVALDLWILLLTVPAVISGATR